MPAHAQRQLVADASHELRTPLATMRTNIEVLTHPDLIDEAERGRLLRDVVSQLPRADRAGRRPRRPRARRASRRPSRPRPVRLDLLAGSGGRARTAPRAGVAFETELEPDDGRAACRPAARARGREPARQRGQVEPARRPDRGPRRRRRARRCATTGRGSRRADLPHVLD